MNQLTSTLLLISLAGAQALAESHSAQNRHFPRGTNAEITHKCQGVERTAQRGWLRLGGQHTARRGRHPLQPPLQDTPAKYSSVDQN